jgi:hypothetical protein
MLVILLKNFKIEKCAETAPGLFRSDARSKTVTDSCFSNGVPDLRHQAALRVK